LGDGIGVLRGMIMAGAIVLAGCGDGSTRHSTAVDSGLRCDLSETEATDTCETDLPGLADAEQRVVAALPKEARLVSAPSQGYPTRSSVYEMPGTAADVGQALRTAFRDAGLLFDNAATEDTGDAFSLNTGPRYYVQVRLLPAASEEITRFELLSYVKD